MTERAAKSEREALLRRLRSLEEKVFVLRAQLAEDAGRDRSRSDRFVDLRKLVGREMRNRALRSRFFDRELFCDPAWNMLVDLFFHQTDQKAISVNNLCTSSCASSTAALRWIGALFEAGFLARARDRTGAGRVLVRLTPFGNAKLTAYFSALALTENAQDFLEAANAPGKS